MKRLFLTITGLVLALTAVLADEITFVASAPSAVVVGQQFKLSYNVNRGNAKEPRIPAIEGFMVLSGPNRSSSMSYTSVNGQATTTHSLTYTYILKAEKEGSFKLPAATVEVEGKQVTSNSVDIKVLPQDKQQQATRSSGSNNGAHAAEISGSDLFMTATLNKTTVYEQQAVLLTYKVYSSVNLTSLNGKMPDLKGFHIQEIELPQQKEWQLEHYKGRNYNVITWKQYLLFPQQTGEIEIPSVAFEGIVAQQVRSSSMDPFDLFFNGGSQYVEVKKVLNTPKQKLTVQNLPAGKPDGFSGGVGEFSVKSSISTTELKANEAVTLRVIISGVGNMKLIKTPEVEFPADFEVYDPKVDNNFSVKVNGLSGNKIIDYLVIPRHGGVYTIPAVKFSYFDVKTQEYKTLETESYTLNVEKGKNSGNEVATSYVSKEDLKLLGQDIRFIKRGETQLSKKGDYLFGSMLYWMWYIVPLLLFAGYIIVYRKKMAENANITKVRTKKANKVAVKRLKNAKKLLAEKKSSEFYDEILKTLWGYVGDKLSISVSQLSKDNIAARLAERGVDEALIKEFEAVLGEAEFARYAPGNPGETMDKVYSMAIDVISKLENTIKR
ncbi:MAG: protein BatD [Bacteroidaceae bacterium]|nr:protein BatD [Bacteroidaceae bacterium]